MSLPQIPDSGNQRIDVIARVIEGKRWAHGAFDAEAAKNRLRAVMAGANGDALAVQRGADVFGPVSVENE